MKSSLEIAQQHELVPIDTLAARIGLLPDEVEPYGRYKAKLSLAVLERLRDAPDGKLVCVTGMTPTKLGEGNTTTLVGLTQGLGLLDKNPVACLREASLGPVFGVKGGATGGGMSQVVPMEDLNLHFTGDMHAIGAANNLLAAMIDASILHGNPHQIDALRVTWRRALDMNDRALRALVVGRGGRANGYVRETVFDITAASEVMAIMSIARDLRDLRHRLGRITAAYSHDGGRPVTAEALRAAGAMTVLLKDALKPNLAQTLEGQPALIHCGPFANIDHGNNSLIADLMAMKLGDYVLTESGFGTDMGMEKFFNIVCRVGKITPAAVVLVVTVRAIKHHGSDPDDPRLHSAALERGISNVRRHLGIIQEFGLSPVLAVNRYPEDSEEEIELVKRLLSEFGARSVHVHDGFRHGGRGAAELAEAVVEACEQPNRFTPLYGDELSIREKIEAVATRVYGAKDVFYYPAAEQSIAQFTRDGLSRLPVSIAKTHLSLSPDPQLLNVPDTFTLPVRDVRANTGAGWLVPLSAEIAQMPGLEASPAAERVDIDEHGRVVGLL
jgi:formyltetrahydrofolate synthetase